MTGHLHIENMSDLKVQVSVLSFYSFTELVDMDVMMPKILLFAKKKCIRGTILLAKEGFNGSVSGKDSDVHELVSIIKKLSNAREVSLHSNYCDNHPFSKMKVKIKSEIVSLKVGDINVNQLKGEYILPENWDEFIMQEDVIVIDTRNNYEIALGTFKGAVNPDTSTFRHFPKWVKQNQELLKDKKVAMFCTGGIRCEKSTAYMKGLQYKDVYHLKGGILGYLDKTKNINNTWQGECFVFDDRFAVSSDLAPNIEYWGTQKKVHI